MDRRQSKRGQTAPATSTEASVDQDAKGRPLSQTDTPARPSAEHSAHAVGRAHCKATRIKASVDDLPHRSGNGAQRIFEGLTAGAIPQ